MILVDTSVWVDHLRRGDEQLADLLGRGLVVMHPFVVGEIACGSLADREVILELLQDLPVAAMAENDEVLRFIDRHGMHGKGIGLVDVHLLASAALTGSTTKLWSRDKRLHAAASDLGCAHLELGAH